jgi:transposase InsO family protein
VRYDNASEYKALGALLLEDYGIQFEYTTIYTPEQNGVSERLNRSLISVARAMLLDAKLPV